MVKLYKIIDGELKFVDFGVSRLTDTYAAQGYIAVENSFKNKQKKTKLSGPTGRIYKHEYIKTYTTGNGGATA